MRCRIVSLGIRTSTKLITSSPGRLASASHSLHALGVAYDCSMTRRKVWVLSLSLCCVAILWLTVAPFLICLYKDYRFNQNIKVRVVVPSCMETSARFTPAPCSYIFSFAGEENPQTVRFPNGEISQPYEAETRTYLFNRKGRFQYKSNIIEISDSGVEFNHQRLPVSSQPVLALLEPDGKLVTGRCEWRWY